ncbi:hypothetical protein ACXYN8_03935 [Altererythrobacter sp. CAU 1778]
MPTKSPIQMPAGFATATAVGFADQNGEFVVISADNPLPTSGSAEPGANGAPPTPLAGTASSSAIVGPFVPLAGRPVILTIQGSWTGVVRLMRSTNGGATKLPVTLAGDPWAVFSTNIAEPVWQESEEGAELYLHLEPSSGAMTYRLSQ